MRKTKTSLPNKKKNNGWRPTARKVTTMKINPSAAVVELSAAEAKKAFTFGTREYRNLQAVRRDYPDFEVVTISTKKSRNEFSDLDMKAIRAYVEVNGTDEQKEHFAFISKRRIDEDGAYCEPLPFFEIKSWFLNSFPEIKAERKAYREKVQAILDEAKSKVAA